MLRTTPKIIAFCISGRVESFGIVRLPKKAFYYETLLKFLANFSSGLSETGLHIKKVYLFFLLLIFLIFLMLFFTP